MIAFENGLYVRIEEVDGARAPMPQPLKSGFTAEEVYRVLGLYSPAETADAYVLLSNGRDELWFISTRHVRTVGVSPAGPLRDARPAFSRAES